MSPKRVFYRDFLVLLIVTLISVPFLLYRLGQLPMLHGDEGASGVQAVIFERGTDKDLFRMGWAEQPMLSFALQGLFLRAFGRNVFGLRTCSVFFALLSIVPFFLILRYFLSFSRLEAGVTSCFYSFSHWFIAMARLGTNYIQVVSLELFSFLFLLWALQAKQSLGRKILLSISGFVSGIPVYLYHAGRLVPLLIISSFALLLPFKKKVIKEKLSHLVFLLLGIAISFLPFIQHYLGASKHFFVRSKDVVLWGKFDDALRYYHVESKVVVILWQFLNTVKVFFVGGDNSEQYGYQGPIIPLIFQPFLVLGLWSAVVNFSKRGIERCLLLCFFSVLFLGGVLTIAPYPPFIPRLIGSMPFAFFFIGLGINYCAASWRSILDRVQKSLFTLGLSALDLSSGRRSGRRLCRLHPLSLLDGFRRVEIKEVGKLKTFKQNYRRVFFLTLVMAWMLVNLKVYFWDYAPSLKAGWANYDPGTTIGYYLGRLGPGWEAVFFGCWKHYPTQGNISFIALDFPVSGEIDFFQAVQMAKERKKNFVFIFLPYEMNQLRDWWEGYRKNIKKAKPQKLGWEKEIETLKEMFPEGSLKKFPRSDGSDFFWAYEVVK